jgi:LCP family protein required for cell wall assembly
VPVLIFLAAAAFSCQTTHSGLFRKAPSRHSGKIRACVPDQPESLILNDEQKPPKPYTKYTSSRLRPKKGRPLRDSSEPVPEFRPGSPGRGTGGSGGAGAAPPGKRRRWGWGKRIGVTLLMLLLLLLVAAGISYWRINRAVGDSNAKVPADVRQVLKPATGGPENILFMGSDKRPGESARADTLLVVRVDRGRKAISQLSIPRDTLVDLPGYGQSKINAGYSYGGPALEIKAVEQLTGLPINHYVELQFDGFPAIVNALGGVDINVPNTIDSQYPQGLKWTQVHFDAGPQHMDGDRALIYVRVRYSDDDFHRMARQQQFMQALQQKMSSPMNAVKMPLIAPDIIGNLVTDMSTNDLLRLAWTKFRTPSDRNQKFVLTGAPEYIGGVDYVVLDKSASQKTINDFLAAGGSR